MLQNKTPRDYVIATGKQYSVKQFVNLVLNELSIKFKWTGKGIKSKCFDLNNNNCIIECNKKYFRPFFRGRYLVRKFKKARRELNWKPKYKNK